MTNPEVETIVIVQEMRALCEQLLKERDEARFYARRALRILVHMPCDIADLDDKLEDLPDWCVD